MTITIDPEFKSLIAPLRPDELAQLEANIAEHGCRDSLVLWHGLLIDGHNRLDICERLGKPYKTVELALASREHVLLWIEENQWGRRNLTDDQRTVIAASVLKRRAKLQRAEQARKVGKQGGRGKKKTHEAASTSRAF